MIPLDEVIYLEWWKAVLLGIVQGLTEFLPISSSAHLVLVPWLFRWQDPGLTFDVALHIGTLVAALVYFLPLIVDVVRGFVRGVMMRKPLADPDSRLGLQVILSCIPAAIFGALLDRPIENFFHRPDAARTAIGIIAVTLIVMGLVLAVAERFARYQRDLKQLTFADAALIGLFQALALIPGVSRSGITITLGLFRGLKRETAARFSFLLSVPVTGGAVLKKLYDLVREGGLAAGERLPFVLGVLTSGIVGFLCIAWLLRFLQRASTRAFTIYRLAIGIVILALLFVR